MGGLNSIRGSMSGLLGGRLAIDVSRTEASESNLPGNINGPADAYRHILWAAELTRRFGAVAAQGITELHERQAEVSTEAGYGPQDARNTEEARAMDRRNNVIGIAIGERAKTIEDVVRMAREVMDASPRDGLGGGLTAVWLPEDQWDKQSRQDSNWPVTSWPGLDTDHLRAYRHGGEAEWRDVAERNRIAAARRRTALEAEKRAAWEAMTQTDEEGEADGTVNVRPHIRDGHPVEGHTRSAPGP